MRNPLLVAAIALLAGGPALGQKTLPRNVVFDDFDYSSTEWSRTTLPDRDGAMRDGAPPPTGSVYGVSQWATAQGDTTARLWYRHGWQEPSHVWEFGTLESREEGLTFALEPGAHPVAGCTDPDAPAAVALAQQITTGFVARRGTWAARVRFGAVGHPDEAGVIQAFWLMSPMGARVQTASGREERVWNEVDHEFNNRFRGDDQPFDYDATGFRGGDGTDPGPRPMFAPSLAGAEAGNPDGLAWTCTAIENGRGERLDAASCSRILANPVGRAREVWSTLFIRVADEGITFGLRAEDGDRLLVMASETTGPTTVLPLTAMLSQHLFPGRPATCDDQSILSVPVETGVDWFYFTPDPSATDEEVLADVATLREMGIPRAATVPGLNLERPDRHLTASSLRFGFGSRTTPLSLALEAPREMAPGETTTLVAQPPLRHGTYRFTWTTSTRITGGRLVTERLPPASFALPFTFPEGADHVIVRVRMEEVDGEGRAVREGPIHPIERRVTIRRQR